MVANSAGTKEILKVSKMVQLMDYTMVGHLEFLWASMMACQMVVLRVDQLVGKMAFWMAGQLEKQMVGSKAFAMDD